MSYLEQNTDAGRIILPDLVRTFALIGIVLVNVAYIAYPGDITYHAGGLDTFADRAAYFSVDAFFLLKSYTLFSFMFGVGLAYQMSAAERHGASFAASYFRRMIALIVLGVVHVTMAFSGDILIVYGVLGLLLYLFRNRTLKTLIRCGIALVVLQLLIVTAYAILLYLFETYNTGEFAAYQSELKTEREKAIAIFSNGSFIDAAMQRWHEWLILIKVVAPLQAPGAFAFFLFGLAAVRAGLFSNPKAPFWRTARRVYLPFGVSLSIAGAYGFVTSDPSAYPGLASMAVLLLAAPFSSLGYIGLIAKWSEGPLSPLKTFLARGGSASLTAYLMQSMILSLLFCGYGLGLYQKTGALGCTIIAFITGLISIVFVSLWRKKYTRGPMEYLLRYWSYFGKR